MRNAARSVADTHVRLPETHKSTRVTTEPHSHRADPGYYECTRLRLLAPSCFPLKGGDPTQASTPKNNQRERQSAKERGIVKGTKATLTESGGEEEAADKGER